MPGLRDCSITTKACLRERDQTERPGPSYNKLGLQRDSRLRKSSMRGRSQYLPSLSVLFGGALSDDGGSPVIWLRSLAAWPPADA